MEGKMTIQEAIQRAADFNDAADDVMRCHLEHFAHLSPAQHAEMHRKEDDLRDMSRQLRADASGIVWEDLQEALKNIRKGTDKMRAVRGHLKNVQRAISFASKALKLGANILAGNIIGVGTSSLGLIDLVNGFRDEDDAEAEAEVEALG